MNLMNAGTHRYLKNVSLIRCDDKTSAFMREFIHFVMTPPAVKVGKLTKTEAEAMTETEAETKPSTSKSRDVSQQKSFFEIFRVIFKFTLEVKSFVFRPVSLV